MHTYFCGDWYLRGWIALATTARVDGRRISCKCIYIYIYIKTDTCAAV